MNITARPIRKPLLYPSELRGHGPATLVHRFDLREHPLALSKLPARVVAAELAMVSLVRADLVVGVLSWDPRDGSPDYAMNDVAAANGERGTPIGPERAALLFRVPARVPLHHQQDTLLVACVRV